METRCAVILIVLLVIAIGGDLLAMWHERSRP